MRIRAVLDFVGPEPVYVPFGIEHKHKVNFKSSILAYQLVEILITVTSELNCCKLCNCTTPFIIYPSYIPLSGQVFTQVDK